MNKTLVSLCLVGALAACSTTSPDVISRKDAQRLSDVRDGTVLSVRDVTVDGSQSGAGAVTGAAVGGIAGSQVGGNTSGAIVGVLAGVAGAVAGNAIERNVTKEDAVEILVQLSNGDRRAIVQAKGSEVFKPGEAIIMVTNSNKTRVVKAPPVTAPGAPVTAPSAPAPAATPAATGSSI